jgi:RNA polymerase sigma-70 factor (ECF subfamily)
MTDSQQFLKLVETHKGIIVKICSIYARRSDEKDDLFQEIVIQLWKAWPNFEGRSQFSTWLYRIALNTAISGLRKRKADLVLMDQFEMPEAVDPGLDTAKEEQLKALYRAIRELPEIDRAVVMLYLEDRSYEEMEDILGINQGTLRVKMNRAKEKLKKSIQIITYGA